MSLVLKDIHFGYTQEQEILHGISVTIEAAQLVTVIGPNGCGKTTLLKCINRIHTLKSGIITLDNLNLLQCRQSLIAKKIGYVPQVSTGVLSGTVVDFLLLGRRQFLGWRLKEKDLYEVYSILQELHIEELANKEFSALSGGQRQKILVARALLQQPDLFVFDEPISNLDLKNQIEIMELGKKLVRDKNKTVVMVVHDLNMALHYADQVILMYDGQIVANGKPKKVLTPERIQKIYRLNVKIENCGYINPFL